MSALAPLAVELIDAVLRHARAHPEIVAELRRIFGPVPDQSPVLQFMKVTEFAQHIGMCKRSVEKLITEGLPIVGKGRRRRVPVTEAMAWLRAGGADAEIEKRAQFDAHRALRREAARKVKE